MTGQAVNFRPTFRPDPSRARLIERGSQEGRFVLGVSGLATLGHLSELGITIGSDQSAGWKMLT